jgi:transposase
MKANEGKVFGFSMATATSCYSLNQLKLMGKAVEGIHTGKFSYREAASMYGVTKYQIEKWVTMLTHKNSNGRLEVVNDALKVQVVKAVYIENMPVREAVIKFGVSKEVVRLWIGMRDDPKKGPKFAQDMRNPVQEPAINEYEQKKVAIAINAGGLSISEACRTYGVSRTQVKNWVSSNSGMYLADLIRTTVYCNMTTEEKNKELEAQLKLLQKQLEEAKLKISGLEMLIEVAEEKFEIKIKKKRGPKPPKE